jgi:hypothetical protein
MSECKLYVGGLPWATTDEDLKEAFGKFGNVVDTRVWPVFVGSDWKIVYDRETNRSRGFGFVTFENDADAEAAIAEMDKSVRFVSTSLFWLCRNTTAATLLSTRPWHLAPVVLIVAAAGAVISVVVVVGVVSVAAVAAVVVSAVVLALVPMSAVAMINLFLMCVYCIGVPLLNLAPAMSYGPAETSFLALMDSAFVERLPLVQHNVRRPHRRQLSLLRRPLSSSQMWILFDLRHIVIPLSHPFHPKPQIFLKKKSFSKW